MNPESCVIRRYAEGIPKSDDMRIDLDSSDVGAGQMPIAELGQRSTAQTEQQYAFGARVEEQESHHLLRIHQIQLVRLADLHGALYESQAEVEREQIVVFDQKGLVVRTTEQGLFKRFSIAVSGLLQFDDAGFDVEGAG